MNIGFYYLEKGVRELVYERWSSEKVVSKIMSHIKELKKNGEPLNSKHAQINHSRLWRIAWDYFGFWDNVLKAVGLDPDIERKAKKGFNPSRPLGRSKLAPSLEQETLLLKKGNIAKLTSVMRELRKSLKQSPTIQEISQGSSTSVKQVNEWLVYRDQLITAYMKLAKQLATDNYYYYLNNYGYTSEKLEDFIAKGYLLLSESFEQFDWSNSNGSFTSYLRSVFETQLEKSPFGTNPYAESLDKVMFVSRGGREITFGDAVAVSKDDVFDLIVSNEYSSNEPTVKNRILSTYLKQLPRIFKEIVLWDYRIKYQAKTDHEMAKILNIEVSQLYSLKNVAIRKLKAINAKGA